MSNYLAFPLLHPTDQIEARRKFSPAGRREGWENIERWAFPVNRDGRLTRRRWRFIEPAYSLKGEKFPELWTRYGSRPRFGN